MTSNLGPILFIEFYRDLKSDNILLEDDGQCPHLVVADFGCSFIGGSLGLRLWYPSDEINKGGNVALMAPEVYNILPQCSFACIGV